MYELNDIFNQLLGETKVLNLDIIYPKYNILFDTYDKSLKVLILLRNHIVLKHIEKDDPSTEEALKNYDEFIKLFEEFLVNNKNNYNIEDFKKKDITLEDMTTDNIYNVVMVEELSDKYKNLLNKSLSVFSKL